MIQKQIIIEHLRKIRNENFEGGWIRGFKLHGLETHFGFIGSSGERRARELFNEGSLEKRMNEGFVEYRYKANEAEEQVHMDKLNREVSMI